MIVSGQNFHSLAEQRELSFVFRGNIDDITGEATFGFSGENKSINFNFSSGKVYDPEGRYFDTYNETDLTQYSNEEDSSIFISGNFSKSSYDYHNKYSNLSCSVGVKDDFKINRFFFDTTGCNLSASVEVFGKPIEYEITSDSNFISNGNWMAKIKNKNEDRSFKIFDLSGTSSMGEYEKVGNYSGLQVTNENSIILKHSGYSAGQQDIILSIDTDMGQIKENFSPLATTKFINFDYTIDQNQLNTVYSGGNIGETGNKQGLFTYNSSLIEGSGASSITKKDRDIDIWLIHHSGATGVYGDFIKITGANVTHSGSDYHETPAVIISGGDPITGIDGKTLPAKLSGMINNGYLTGFKVIQSGIYNTQGGAPSLVITGGGSLAITGSGEATSGYHPKHFTGYWDVAYSTGTDVFESFRPDYYQSSAGGYYQKYTIDKDWESVNIRVSFDNADEDKMVSKLRIDGYNSNQDEFFLTGAISGSDLFLI
jgi:hypothetical protein